MGDTGVTISTGSRRSESVASYASRVTSSSASSRKVAEEVSALLAEADRLALEFYQRHTTAVQPTDEQLLADVTPFNG